MTQRNKTLMEVRCLLKYVGEDISVEQGNFEFFVSRFPGKREWGQTFFVFVIAFDTWPVNYQCPYNILENSMMQFVFFKNGERETCGLNIERPMLCAKKFSFIFKIHRRILTAYLVFYWYLRLISSSTHRWFKNVRCILGISILILDF